LDAITDAIRALPRPRTSSLHASVAGAAVGFPTML